MEEAVKLNPKLRKKFDALIQFDIDGSSYTLDASHSDKPGKLQVSTSLATLYDLLQKKISPQKAFMKGMVKVKGKMSLAMKLSAIMEATKRHLSPQSRL